MSTFIEKGLALPSHMVHLWHCCFDDVGIDLKALEALLSNDERQKAGKFKFKTDRRRSVISRGVLRLLLGQYLQKHPRELEFRYTDYGKPFLKEDVGLRFNLSHSDQRAVFGFVQKAEIGVDIEKVRQDFDVLEIARHFFSSDEIRSLEGLQEEERAEGFYRCWTRKEAFIKAKGSGLSFPLTSFSVSLDAERVELLRTDWDASERKEWQLMTYRPSESYQVALAVRGRIDSVVERDWNSCFARRM